MVTKQIGLKRILKLADFMETVPREKFDFSTIVGGNWGGKPDLSCGTTACALGWATAMPLFRKAGLYLDKDSLQVDLACSSSGYGGWSAIGHEVFSISLEAMHALFQPNVYEDSHEVNEMFGDYPSLGDNATPKQWAKHARKMVKILQTEAV